MESSQSQSNNPDPSGMTISINLGSRFKNFVIVLVVLGFASAIGYLVYSNVRQAELIESNAAEIEAVSTELQSIGQSLAYELANIQATNEMRLSDVSQRSDTISTDLDTLARQADQLTDAVSTLGRQINRISTEVGNIESDTDEIQGEIASLRRSLIWGRLSTDALVLDSSATQSEVSSLLIECLNERVIAGFPAIPSSDRRIFQTSIQESLLEEDYSYEEAALFGVMVGCWTVQDLSTLGY